MHTYIQTHTHTHTHTHTRHSFPASAGRPPTITLSRSERARNGLFLDRDGDGGVRAVAARERELVHPAVELLRAVRGGDGQVLHREKEFHCV
jgi:hypothetical protein